VGRNALDDTRDHPSNMVARDYDPIGDWLRGDGGFAGKDGGKR
jgi:hypothetical protein